MAQENPYQAIAGLMMSAGRAAASPMLALGKVIAEPPDVQIAYNGIVLTKEELWIGDYLMRGHPRTAKGHLVSATQFRAGGSGDPAYESHNHDIRNDYTDTIETTDTDLKPGSMVLLAPLATGAGDRQQYAVICHVSRAR